MASLRHQGPKFSEHWHYKAMCVWDPHTIGLSLWGVPVMETNEILHSRIEAYLESRIFTHMVVFQYTLKLRLDRSTEFWKYPMATLRFDFFFMVLQTFKKLIDFLYGSTTSKLTTLFKQCEITCSIKIDPPEIT